MRDGFRAARVSSGRADGKTVANSRQSIAVPRIAGFCHITKSDRQPGRGGRVIYSSFMWTHMSREGETVGWGGGGGLGRRRGDGGVGGEMKQ